MISLPPSGSPQASWAFWGSGQRIPHSHWKGAKALCSQLLGLRSDGQTRALTSPNVPSASTGPFMLARPESEAGRKGSSPNTTNKRQLAFKRAFLTT